MIMKYCGLVEELETKDIGLDSRGTMTVVMGVNGYPVM